MQKKYKQFFLGLAFITLFVGWLVPTIVQQKQAQKVLNHIEERNIDTDALFYTESEEARVAEYLMRKKQNKKD